MYLRNVVTHLPDYITVSLPRRPQLRITTAVKTANLRCEKIISFGEIDRIGEGAVVAYFKVLPQYSSVANEDNRRPD
jgi:hypothetical protein